MRTLRVAFYVLLFVAGLALYTVTLHGDVQPADSGEFQLVALKLGVAHPPGYPLFSLLGWLFGQMPIGSPYARVSFLSAVVSAATLLLVARAVEVSSASESPGRALLPALAAASALATATTFWAQATTTNIRSLTAFFTAAMIFAAGRAMRGRPALLLFAVAFGLGVGHHPSLLFVGAALGAFVLWRERPTPRMLGAAAGVVLATQLLWLYLPLRDVAGVPLAPGGLRTISGFLDHVLARGFGGDMLYFVQAEPARFWDRVALLPMLLNTQFSLELLVLMGIALCAALVQQRALAATLLGAFALHMFITLTYRAPQTIEYALPAWVIACAVLGIGAAALQMLRSPKWLPTGLVSIVAISVAISSGAARLPSFLAAAADRSARNDAEAVLRYAHANSVILGQWHQITPIWALQQIDGIQPTVEVRYVAPAGAQPYAETFAQRAHAAAASTREVFVTSLFDAENEAAGLRAFPLSNTPAWRVAPLINLTRVLREVVFDARINVVAPAGLDGQTMAAGQSVPVDIWWRVRGAPLSGDSIAVRILRRDGRLAATADVRVTDDAGAYAFRRQMLTLPLDLDPGDYDVLAAVYRATEAGFVQYTAADGAQAVAVARVHVTPAFAPAATRRALGAGCRTCAAPQLIGVDYDLGVPNRVRLWTHWQLGVDTQPSPVQIRTASGSVIGARDLPPAQADARYFSLPFDIPPERGLRIAIGAQQQALADYQDGERYVPFGDQMALIGVDFQRGLVDSRVDLTWLAARPLTRDWIVSVRLRNPTHLDAAHDGVPALGAVPTLKWIAGMRIVDRHPLRTDDAGPPYTGAVLVYDSATQLPLNPLDERYERGFEFVVQQ
jgi:hypothetical protein